MLFQRPYRDYRIRALLYTLSARCAKCFVYNSDSVFYGYGIAVANIRAVAESYAAVFTVSRSAVKSFYGATAPQTVK